MRIRSSAVLQAAAAVLTAVLPASADTRLEAVFEISLHASPDGPGFRDPLGVSTDPFGNLFVADTGNHRVVHFDPDGRFVFEFGGYGWGEGELSGPTDVCAREGFRLFVVDAGNERIQEFDIGDSSPEGSVFPFREGEGLGGEALVRPTRMDVDAEGRIYVSDGLCHCVWIFGPTGVLVTRLGGLGDAAARFHDPAGVAVGPRGRVYVADSGNHRIQVFDSVGNWVAAWSGPEGDALDLPTGIDIGPDGTVWISDAGTGRVRAFTPAGVPVFSFGAFRYPVDVAVDAQGRVWVVDGDRQVVEGYRIERVPGDP